MKYASRTPWHVNRKLQGELYYLMTSGEVGTEMLIPFTGGFENGYFLDLGWLFVPALFFIVLGTDNGVNFTDGLDGLCTPRRVHV